ncbi:MAG: hypothetical protein ACREQ9_23340, partial [Candidatus Binatia bacterium]
MWADLTSGAALVFAAPRSLWLCLLLPLVAVSIWFAPRRSLLSLPIVALRLAALTLIVLAIAGLSVQTKQAGEGLCIVIAEDVSESVGAAGRKLGEELVRSLIPKLERAD